eukprot:Em0003g1220a
MLRVVILAVVTFASGCCGSAPCYDHQNVTYKSTFVPATCDTPCTATPFFSPDTSLSTYVDLIESAIEAIDIFTPDFNSFGSCTNHNGTCGGHCIGCTLEDQRNESFPIFAALLNAVHLHNVSVRLLINDYYVPTCQGMIAPLDWLSLNGIQVRLYRTTTFLHSKFVMIDYGRRTSVSSVNFSYTSFLKNREAGIILDQCSCSAIGLYKSVFENDWDLGYDYVVSNTYTSSELEYITDPSMIPYAMSHCPARPGVYVAPLIPFKDVTVKIAYTGPDYAYDTVMAGLAQTRSSLQVMIYQITDTALCNEMLNLSMRGVNVTLLVSSYVVSYTDYLIAKKCYDMLYNSGLNGHIRKTSHVFTFSHQKFWIIDNSIVHLSTGNWSPDDVPDASIFPPYADSGTSVFRDMFVAVENPGVVRAFQDVFNNDWAIGTDWGLHS